VITQPPSSPHGGARVDSRQAVLRLMRPRQWPILTAQLAVGVLAAPACAVAVADGPEAHTAIFVLFGAWLGWVVCLNGGTLAFNSAYDRDVHDIAYLRDPPPPPSWLAGFALCVMIVGAALATALLPLLGLVTALCVALSVLYSHPAVRWKSVPGADLAVNMVGYGGGTTLAGLLAGQLAFAGAEHQAALLRSPAWLLVLGFALLFGSFYPATQLYQLADDRERGDRTLAAALGRRPSLVLSIVLGWAASVCFVLYLGDVRPRLLPGSLPMPVSVLLAAPALIAWQAHLHAWYFRVRTMTTEQQERGMYRALVLWALVDVGVLAGIYWERLFGQ